eukprot:jgi/Hompol1/5891/HPOL_004772-RA
MDKHNHKHRLARRRLLQSGGKHTAAYHSVGDADAVRRALLEWFDSKGRASLPWRSPFQLPGNDSNNTNIQQNIDTSNQREWLAQRAYRVWVSEIMLQQTQVATVIPFFEAWMAAWPTVEQLAAANIEEINSKWSGLGYYSRARRLHEGAQIVVKQFGGLLPSDAADLQKHIPGVGPYTAGAISSIAFNKRAPIVDGNVTRVVSRLCAFGADPKAKSSVALHWDIAGKLVDPDRPGDFNQALMDLGATVCTPQSPSCKECPLSAYCMAHIEETEYHTIQSDKLVGSQNTKPRKRARVTTEQNHDNLDEQDGDAESSICTLCPPLDTINDIESFSITRYPLKVQRKLQRLQACAVSIISCQQGDDADPSLNQKFLVVKSPKTGLLAGLWDLPRCVLSDIDPNDSDAEAIQEIPDVAQRRRVMDAQLATVLGSFDVVSRKDLGSVLHIFTHIRRTMYVEHIVVKNVKCLDP